MDATVNMVSVCLSVHYDTYIMSLTTNKPSLVPAITWRPPGAKAMHRQYPATRHVLMHECGVLVLQSFTLSLLHEANADPSPDTLNPRTSERCPAASMTAVFCGS